MGAANQDYHGDELAIVGIAIRLPGASTTAEFWRNLSQGIESIRFFSDDELRAAGVAEAELAQPGYVKSGGGWIDDIELFDAAFFGLSPREAQTTDPQHRLFLEAAHEAFEDAGYAPDAYDGEIGVFAGAGRPNYLLENLLHNRALCEAVGIVGTTIGTDRDFLPLRVSYAYDLHGPSVNVQTACSTGLVAVHLAGQSLLAGECDLALAGGVSITTLRPCGYLHEEGGVYSPDGHCRAFDADAKGMVGANGLAVVALKRLSDALEDGDRVRAVVKGTAINNDGSGKVGFTAPGIDGQARVIEAALAAARVPARDIAMVEAHGTGTALGDPVEVAALTQAYRAQTEDTAFCALGSVKTNIGHSNAAAGVAGMVKVALALEHGAIPGTLHFQRPSPDIDFASSPFTVSPTLRSWPGGDRPRRAAVSSFGLGGTNAHAVLEAAPARESGSDPGRAHQVLVVSAKTVTALDQACVRLADHLATAADHPADVAFTLQVGRQAMPFRRALVVPGVTPSDLAAAATALRGATGYRGEVRQRQRPVAFLFPGQGAQFAGMGRGLYATEPVFRDTLDQCAELLREPLGEDLRALLFPQPAQHDDAQAALARTRYTQPALFAVEYALAQTWMGYGVTPAAMLGHSVGELTAACLGGVFTLQDALRLVAARGRLMDALPEGDMLGVALSEAELAPRLAQHALSLAAVNAPEACVVSGPAAAVAALRAELEAAEIPCRPLHTSHAFHSAMMAPMVAEFEALVATAAPQPCQVRCFSTQSGALLAPDAWADPGYWAQQVRQPVRFAQALAALATDSDAVLLEVGPGQTLTTLAAQTEAAAPRPRVASMRGPKDADDAQACTQALLEAMARLWVAGVEVDWIELHGDERRLRVALPTYPFERQRYWVDADPAGAADAAPAQRAPLDEWFYTTAWRACSTTPTGSPLPAGPWLLLHDEHGVLAEVGGALRGAGAEVIDVHGGAVAAPPSAAAPGRVRPGERADYVALLRALVGAPGQVVHGFGVHGGKPRSGVGALDRVQNEGFFSVLALAQAWAEVFPDAPLQLTTVTDDLLPTPGHAGHASARAAVLGVVRVLPLEEPHHRCRHVDLQSDGAPAAALRAALAHAGTESELAWRDGGWLTAVPVRIPITAPAAPLPWERSGGVFVVTGGLGGIGAVLAGHLAALGRTKLVLTARTALPPDGEWDAWCAQHGTDDPQSRRIARVRALRDAGAEVLVAAVDAAAQGAMRTLLDDARRRFGPLRGVVHAAGSSPGGVVALRDPTGAAAVLEAKVRGALLLQELTAQDPLELFCLCGSLTSVLGAVGAADYCGANAVLDLLGPQLRGGVTVGWDAWTETGMTAESEVPQALRAAREEVLALGIRNAEGVEVLRRAAASGLGALWVSTRDLTQRARAAAAADDAVVDEAVAPAAPTEQHQRPDLPTAYAAAEDDVQRRVVALYEELLGIESIGIHDNFFELGGHSLLLVRLNNALKRDFAAKLSMADMFQHPTVAQLARRLAGEDTAPALDETADRAARQRKAFGRLGPAGRKPKGGGA